MTDLTPTDDEMLSSHLDGRATPEEVARIEADPALIARGEALRVAAAIIGTPVSPLGPADADRLIGAALDVSATADAVTDLGARQQWRERLRQPLVAVAAGVLVLGLAVPLVLAINSATDGDTTTAGESTGASSATDTADAAAADADLGESEDEAVEELGLSADTEGGDVFDAAPEATETATEPAEEAPADDGAPLAARALLFTGALGPYGDSDELADALAAIWAERDRDAAALPGANAFFYEALPCGVALVEYIDWPDARIDLTVVELDGTSVTVALADIGDGVAIAATAVAPDCAVHELLELSDG